MKCRKLLAILLALVMVIGLLPFAALAEEVPGSSPGDEVSDNLVADQNDPLPDGDPLGTDPEDEPQDEPLPEGDPLGEQSPEVSLLNNEHHAGATALKSTDSALSDGSYYLSRDVELNQPVTFSGTATLCLNGYTLSCGSDKVITVDGTLTICDCADGGKIEATDRANFAINVERNGTLNVEGGTICGGSRGISGSSNSEINISGGKIQKSASSRYKALELTGTTATITGGTITGGVELMRSSELSLGGTPAVDTIKLTHKSCSINATAANEAYSGEPITIDYGNLDYSDGTAIVSGVTEENFGKFNVTAPEGMVVKLEENGNLVFGEPESEPGHSHDGDDDSVTWTELTAENRQLTSGHYYLGNNITVSETTGHISITGDVTLCLNSHALTSTVAQTSFIYVENGGSLTLCDCGNGGKVESLCNSICHVIFVRKGGSCTIERGMISGIDDTLNGETIMVDSGGFLTLNGGTVTGSTGIYNQGTTTVSGGTVACDKYGIHVGGNLGVVNMESGSVSATGTGSDKVSGIYMNYGSLVMTGGTVSGTTYGIELQTAVDNKSFVISGGTITGGYGIYFNSEKCKSPLYLTGDPTLSTLRLSKPTTLIFASKGGSPYSGDEITVSLESGENENAVIISGISNNANKFTYAGENFELAEDGKGNLILQTPTTAPEHENHGVDGTDDDPVGWTAWNGTDALNAGSYYLEANAETNSAITVNGDVHLCLNGHTLAGTMTTGDLFLVESGALTICDCKGGGTINASSTGIKVTGEDAAVTIHGGDIRSQQKTVWLDSDCSLEILGGSLTSQYSAAVYAIGLDNAVIEVSDGSLSGYTYGMQLKLGFDGSATVSGGSVTGTSKTGYGIRLETSNFGTLRLTGAPTVTGTKGGVNTMMANKIDAAGYSGGTIDVAYYKGSRKDGDIIVAGAADASCFRLVYPTDKVLVPKDGNLVLGEEADLPAAHTHGVDGAPGDRTWTAWDGTRDLAADGHYYLADNVTLTETIQVGADVHLCLNGKTLASTADYAVEVTEGHALTICDCGESGSIERTHHESDSNGCAVRVRGDFTLYGGSLENHGSQGYGIFVMAPDGRPSATIAGGSVYSDVNAIQVNTASDVTLSGGQVSGKKSGVLLANDGISFTMTGGSVTAENERGIATNNYDITLSISDGTIRGGDAGIRLLTTSGGGTTISGGTITSKEGVGIDQKDLSGWGEEGQEATLTLTGVPKIESLRLEVAGKVNGAGYTGEALDVAFVKDDAADGDIVIAGATDPAKFNLTAPADKILVAQGGNLVLGVEAPAYDHYHGVDGTDDDPVGWTAWDGTTDLENGAYYLTDNVALARGITVSGDAHLCLNGFTVTDAVSESNTHIVFRVEDEGSLTICDCSDGEAGKVTTSKDAVLFEVNGDLTLYGGMLRNLNGQKERVTLSFPADSTGSFTMTGGTVTAANRAMNVDGAAHISIQGGQVTSNNTYAMDISGGCTVEISGGTVSSTYNPAIYVKDAAPDITISGGAITASNSYGIQLNPLAADGRVAVSGGTITSNTTAAIYLGASSAGTLALRGMPVLNGDTADLDLHVSGGVDGAGYQGEAVTVWYRNSKAQDGDTVIANTENTEKFTLTQPAGKKLWPVNGNLLLGGATTAPEDPNAHTHGVDGTEGAQAWTAWDGSGSLDTDGYYYLTKNVSTTGRTGISVSADVHLCLNGFTISGTERAFTVSEDASLTICDCSEEKTGKITSSGRYGYTVSLAGEMTLYGGEIANESTGDAVFLSMSGGQPTFTMEDGKVSSNGDAIMLNTSGSAATIHGGEVTSDGMGVELMSSASFTMTGGSIAAGEEGVRVGGYAATVTISGGSISGGEEGDGGVYLNLTEGGTAAISGGSISAGNGKGVLIPASNAGVLTLSGAPTIDCLAMKVAGKVNGAGYAGAELDVSYESDNAQNGDIVIVDTTDLAKFNLTAPEGKILVAQGGNLVLGEETVEVPELVLSALPETVTYGDTFTLTATGGGEGTLTWAATGAASVDKDGTVTITDAGSFTITATKGGKEATATGTAVQKAVTIAAKAQTIAYGASIATGTGQVTVTGLVSGDSLRDITLSASDTAITPSGAAIEKNGADVTDNYTISYVSGVLTVTGQPQEGFAVTGDPESVTYGDTFKLDTTGGSGTGAVTWSATGAATVDQEGNVTITGAGDFTIKATKAGDATYAEATATYQATAQKRALTITADNETIAFNAAAPSYTATVTGAVQADKEAIAGAYTLTCEYQQGDPVGDYTITVTGTLSGTLASNYTVTTHNGKLHVVKALAEVEDAPDAVRNLVYTGNAQKLVTPGTAKNGTMVYSLDNKNYSETVPTATNADTYTVWYKVVGNNGYSDTAAKSFNVTIQKAALTVTADDIWVYAGNTPKFTATIKGYVNGEDGRVLKGELTFTCGYSQKYSKPGSRYTITPKGLTADNYDITFKTGTLTVKDPLSPRFNVYVLDSKHGTVEADCRYARKGDVVTLTIKPDWGYELETLTVTDSHGYELKLTYHSNGTYTFTMPRDNVTVKAIFTVRDMPFVDVPGDAWYAGGVRYVYAHGLMNGTGNWRFSPNRTTTRAMIATILYRMEGSPRVYGTSQFGDVEAGSWYEDAVIWATQNDIVEGYTSKTFGPNDPITREQMAAMLYRYADYCRCDMSAGRYVDLSKYSDMNEISDYAIPALRWAVGEEIIEGRTGKRLAPTDTATRAEVAVMLMRFCEDVIW